MTPRRVLALGVLAAALAGPATADTQPSRNWAGYAVTAVDGTSSFRSVSATWVQPRAACGKAAPDAAAAF